MAEREFVPDLLIQKMSERLSFGLFSPFERRPRGEV